MKKKIKKNQQVIINPDDGKDKNTVSEALGWNLLNNTNFSNMTTDEHIKAVENHAKHAIKLGKNSTLGKRHIEQAKRHLFYFSRKDSSPEGAKRMVTAYTPLKEESVLDEVSRVSIKRKAKAKKKISDFIRNSPIKEEASDLQEWGSKGKGGLYKHEKIAKEKWRAYTKREIEAGRLKSSGNFVKPGEEPYTKKENKKMNEDNLSEAKRGRPRKVQDAESNEHINMQLRKVISLRGQPKVNFADGSSHSISPEHAHKALGMHDNLRTSIEKGEFAKRLSASHSSFHDAIAGKPAPKAKPKITLGAGFGAKHLNK